MANPLIIKKVHLTEKSTDLSQFGKYIFDVHQDATAPEVKKAIETAFKVNVVRVNMINHKNKSTRFRRIISKGGFTRKAIVTLRSGEKLDIVPQ